MAILLNYNGFEIRDRLMGEVGKPYVVYHPNFAGVYLKDFDTFDEAESFCEQEDTDYWAEQIRKG